MSVNYASRGEMNTEQPATQTELTCGCSAVRFVDGITGIKYCTKHKAAPDMYEALIALCSALMFLKGDLRKILGDTEYDALSKAYTKAYVAKAKAEGGKNDLS